MGPIGTGWDRVFWDDFDDPTLAGWERNSTPTGREAANIYASGSELVIEIRETGHATGITWGACGTGSQRFGPGSWFECEARVQAGGRGSWSAFWLSDSDTSGGAADGGEGYGSAMTEPDVFEYLHTSLASAGNNYYTLHTWAPSHVQDQTIVDHGVDLSSGYHRWALHWDDGFLRWYFDDQLVKEETAGFYEKACRVIFQNQTDYADVWPGPVDGSTTHPHYLRVRWVGVWQKAAWHGYQRIQYTPGSLTAPQQTEMLNALRRQYRTATASPTQYRTQVRTSGAQGWLVELSGPAVPSRADWVDILYTQITGMDRATMNTNLVVTTATGADWDAMRVYAKGQGW